ncbi:DUF1963 domain-containing protein [Flavobacterium hauense]
MNFFKKLFGSKGSSKRSSIDSSVNEALCKLVKPSTAIIVNDPKRPPENSQLLSHFGGQPYFEEGESWPLSQSGRPMEFIFQVFNDAYDGIPENIKLIQFFYDSEETAWETENDGWKVKIYEALRTEKLTQIAGANEKTVKYCEISFEKSMSLPNWETLQDEFPELADQISMDDEDDYEAYEEACAKITGPERESSSSFGGYPDWIQGVENFMDAQGKPLDLLFQIDSEDNANVMWGDTGIIYVFYDNNTKSIEFVLQCF